jgi:hypothetical protein
MMVGDGTTVGVAVAVGAIVAMEVKVGWLVGDGVADAGAEQACNKKHASQRMKRDLRIRIHAIILQTYRFIYDTQFPLWLRWIASSCENRLGNCRLQH